MTRSSLLLGAVFAAAFAVTLMVKMPLALALSLAGSPLDAGQVTGTVWDGRIAGAVVNGYALGDVTVEGTALPLLTGRVGGDVSIAGPLVNGRGRIDLGVDTVALRNTNLAVDLSALELRDAFGTPMGGTVEIAAEKLILSGDRCEAGTVRVGTNALSQSARAYGGEGFPLSGEGVCTDGVFQLPLSGDGAEGTAEVAIRVSGRGYHTEVTFVPSDPQLAQALGAVGFDERDGRYSLVQRGQVF